MVGCTFVFRMLLVITDMLVYRWFELFLLIVVFWVVWFAVLVVFGLFFCCTCGFLVDV